MQILFEQFAGSLLRLLLGVLGGWLIAHGWTNDGDWKELTAAAVAFLVAASWAAYQKYHGRQKLLTAIAMPTGTTELMVKSMVSKGASPSVLTPPDERPTMTPVSTVTHG